LKTARLALAVILALLIAQSVSILPLAEADRPKNLGDVSGTLNPGDVTDPPPTWQLNEDTLDFVFYYKITGGSGPDDVVTVTIGDSGIPSWQSLMGEGWEYCECALDAGSYSVTVQASAGATAPVSFEIGFYAVPEPPVDFSGRIPASSNVRYSDFAVLIPAGSYTLLVGLETGTYEFLVDDESKGVVTQTLELSVEFEEGLHVLTVDARVEGLGNDVGWSVQIQGPPQLEVSIVNPCPVLNPESGQSVCVTGAEVTASDGSNPSVSYLWNAPDGTFNSTTSQWVEWTVPPGVAEFTLTVEASAPGYLSDTDSLTVRVAPEFPSAALTLLMAAALAIVSFTRRQRRTTHSAQ